MNTKKKILALALCVVYMFSAAVFAAAEDIAPEAQTVTVTVIDSVAGTLKISGTAPSGTAGEGVTLLVTNVDVNDDTNNDFEDIEANISTRVQYQDTVITGEGGNFEKEFTLLMDTAIADAEDGSVTFDFYAGGEAYAGYEVATASLWYAPVSVKIAAAKGILEEADASAAGSIIDTNKAVFSVESELFDSLDKAELATLLKSKVAEDAFEGYDEEAGNEEDYLEAYASFESALKLSIALEGFNQNKKSIVLDGTTILNDDYLGITAYLSSESDDRTLDTIYGENIKSTGVTAVLDSLFGKNVTEASELQKIFAKEILVQGLKNNKQSGKGIVSTIVTEDNMAAAGFDVTSVGEDTLKTEYFAITDKDDIDNDIYTKRNSITAANLEAEIIASAEKDYTPDNPTTETTTNGRTGNFSVGIGGGTVDSATSFIDLDGYDWAKAAILALAEKNIINGVGDQRFNPAGTLTREQAAKIICLAVGINPVNEGVAFADVDPSAWYAPYITALNKAGIINGVSETAFGVGSNVTREDFAVMICRALNYSTTNSNNFTDKDSISEYALNAVSALYERGIVGGYEDGSFRPKANISRAEGAKIIYGILSK